MKKIEHILAKLNRPVEVKTVIEAPQVYRVQLQPKNRILANGSLGILTQPRHLRALRESIALELKISNVDVEVDDGKLWLVIPKEHRDDVRLHSMWSVDRKVPFILGKDMYGENLSLDLTLPSSPHVLIAGTTGSGKSECLKSAVAFLLAKKVFAGYLLIDTKYELNVFEHAPYVIVCNDPGDAVAKLEKLRHMADERFRNSVNPDVAGRWVIVVDEMADLVLSYPEVETVIVRLAQKVRAAGMHLILATQRPTVDVVTGLIKANMPVRVAFQTVSKTDSRVIIDQPGAERLLGKGDGLLMMNGVTRRFQGAWLGEKGDEWIAQH